MPRTPKPPDWNEMVAVASGRTAVVAEWVAVLRGAGLRPLAVDACSDSDHVEVWVRRDEADHARDALREAGGPKLIW